MKCSLIKYFWQIPSVGICISYHGTTEKWSKHSIYTEKYWSRKRRWPSQYLQVRLYVHFINCLGSISFTGAVPRDLQNSVNSLLYFLALFSTVIAVTLWICSSWPCLKLLSVFNAQGQKPISSESQPKNCQLLKLNTSSVFGVNSCVGQIICLPLLSCNLYRCNI